MARSPNGAGPPDSLSVNDRQEVVIEACEVCGRAIFPALGVICDHTPEEWAKASVSRIMAKHGSSFRAAFCKVAGCLTSQKPSPIGASPRSLSMPQDAKSNPSNGLVERVARIVDWEGTLGLERALSKAREIHALYQQEGVLSSQRGAEGASVGLDTEQSAALKASLTRIMDWFDAKFRTDFPNAPIRSAEASVIEEAIETLELVPWKLNEEQSVAFVEALAPPIAPASQRGENRSANASLRPGLLGPDTEAVGSGAHEAGCRLVKAATCAVEIECEHGFGVCPICDRCTCGPFQARVEPWMRECFGDVIPFDRVERCDRFTEEVFELLQWAGYDPGRIETLRDYTWSRPVGEGPQEVGGVMVTLAALCLAFGLDMHEAGETELARIWTKVPQIRAKQAAKPRGIALPIATATLIGGLFLGVEGDQGASVAESASTALPKSDGGGGH